MATEIKILASVKNGLLQSESRRDFEKAISSLKDGNVELAIKIHRNRRSNSQNSYYWKIIIPMIREAMNEFGNDFTKEETHEFLKKEFNWEEKEMKEGYFVKVPRSTTKMNTVEFMDYKEKIQQFASEVLGIYVPDPNESTDDGGLIVADFDKTTNENGH